MLEMINVAILEDGTVRVHVHVYDSRLAKPDFDIHFDPVSGKIFSSVDSLSMLYVRKAIFGFNMRKRENNLKGNMTYVWY